MELTSYYQVFEIRSTVEDRITYFGELSEYILSCKDPELLQSAYQVLRDLQDRIYRYVFINGITDEESDLWVDCLRLLYYNDHISPELESTIEDDPDCMTKLATRYYGVEWDKYANAYSDKGFPVGTVVEFRHKKDRDEWVANAKNLEDKTEREVLPLECNRKRFSRFSNVN